MLNHHLELLMLLNKSSIKFLAFLFFDIFVGVCIVSNGCANPNAREMTLEGIFAAELQRCVAEAHTLAESKACRQGVESLWLAITDAAVSDGKVDSSLDSGLDGGSEGGDK